MELPGPLQTLVPLVGMFTFWVIAAVLIYHAGCMMWWSYRKSPTVCAALALACVLAGPAR
jgi:hypothetical protein